MTTFLPSRYPRSRRPARNASTGFPKLEADAKPRNPIRGTFPACCAFAASGAARRPSMMLETNARRYITRRGSSSPGPLRLRDRRYDPRDGRPCHRLKGGRAERSLGKPHRVELLVQVVG